MVESAGNRDYVTCFCVSGNAEIQTHTGHTCSETGSRVHISGPHCPDHSVVTDLEGPTPFVDMGAFSGQELSFLGEGSRASVKV